MSSPHYIVVPRPKPPARRQQVPAGDGFSLLLASSLIVSVIFWRPNQKRKPVAPAIPDDVLLRVNAEPKDDPFGYRVTA